MSTRLSRRKLASYAAAQLAEGQSAVIDELAALIVDEGRQRELPLIVRDIEAALLERGIAIADISSAYDATSETKSDLETLVKQQTGAKTVHLRAHTDPSLLGGVQLGLPGQQLDATIRRRLNNLKAMKV